MEREGVVEQYDVEMETGIRLDMPFIADHRGHRPPPPPGFESSSTTVKRARSPSLEGLDSAIGRKRFREEGDTLSPPSNCEVQGAGSSCPSPSTSFPTSSSQPTATMKFTTLVNELAQELQCGCCAELVYHPVVVSPCQHFFCGSCCFLWIKNGGTSCPACRGASRDVTHSRPLQAMVDVLLRSDPSRIRAERERMQADEVYKPGQPIRIPSPREASASPEPNFNHNPEYVRPCPHCASENQYGWRCPQPVIDYATDPERAWHVDDGAPPGHAYCGNCENLLALKAPNTTKCDFCQVSFCGISVHERCVALPLNSQQPQGMNDIADFVQSSEIYDCFDNNTAEVEIMLDFLATRQISPKDIYRNVALYIQAQPSGFRPLIELEIFVESHHVAGGTDEDPSAPRALICRHCATEVLLWGLKEWWVRERDIAYQNGQLPRRPDCQAGSGCGQQKDLAHAKEFNHIISQPPMDHDTAARTNHGVEQDTGTSNNSGNNDDDPDDRRPRVGGSTAADYALSEWADAVNAATAAVSAASVLLSDIAAGQD